MKMTQASSSNSIKTLHVIIQVHVPSEFRTTVRFLIAMNDMKNIIVTSSSYALAFQKEYTSIC